MQKLKQQKHDGATTKRVIVKGDPFEQLSWAVRPSVISVKPTNDMIIYHLNEIVDVVENVNYGDVVDLVYNKKSGRFRARKVDLPADNGELVLWLFDLPKKWRAKSKQEYKEMRDERVELLNTGKNLFWYKEFIISGGKLTFAKKTIGSDPICLTGQIISEFAEEAIREILTNEELRNLLAYEDIAIREILRSRFGFTQDDFNDLRI